jgi:RNA polymerase sigma-70 factor (ECF subfamily)
VSPPNLREPASEDPALRVLMAEYQGGSVEAFDRLHDALAPALKGYLTSLTRDATRADDLLQETFLQMHRARASHTPGEPVRPWVFAIAKRVFLMYVRGTKRRQRYEQDERHEEREHSSASAAQASSASSSAVPATADRIHARRSIESALRQVPADGRRAFLMHHLFGFSFKEIAEKLGIKPGAAKIRSSRAASFMRSLLREKRDE